ncbi:MAG: hypothetical protein IPO37_03535 [Saprospiraceae bacterium]|nr:hypothetical protein [Saprospiraceae bacterium]
MPKENESKLNHLIAKAYHRQNGAVHTGFLMVNTYHQPIINFMTPAEGRNRSYPDDH